MAELHRQGIDSDVSMTGIGDAVLELSQQRGGSTLSYNRDSVYLHTKILRESSAYWKASVTSTLHFKQSLKNYVCYSESILYLKSLLNL